MFLSKLNEVLASKKSFISDRLNMAGLGIALLINIIHWLILYIKIKPDRGSILLQYNVVYGATYIDKSIYIYLIPLTALIFFLLNFILGMLFYKRENVAAYFLNFANIPVQLVFLAASLALIVINV